MAEKPPARRSRKSSKKKNYKFLEMMASHAAHAMRVRVHHHVLQREVEFRILAEKTPRRAARIFFQELKDLIEIDHPAFLPILERGMIRGCHCYTVPLRFHKTLKDLVDQESFGPDDRRRALRAVASGMCAAHLAGVKLGAISPAQLAWDPISASAYFLHHQLTPGDRPPLDPRELPDDVSAREPTSTAADVYHWGVLAYWLLSGGERPASPARDLLELAPEADPQLAAAVMACLAPVADDRPHDGPELNSLLQMASREPAAAAAPPDAAAAGPSTKVVTENLRKLRKTGRIPQVQPAPPPNPEARPDQSLPEGLESDLEAGVDVPSEEEEYPGDSALNPLGDSMPPRSAEGAAAAAEGASAAAEGAAADSEGPGEASPDDPPGEPDAGEGEAPEAGTGRRPLPSGVTQKVAIPRLPRPGASSPGAPAAPVPADQGLLSGLEIRKRKPSLLEGLAVGFVFGFAVGGWTFYLGRGSSPTPPPGPTGPVIPRPTRPVTRPPPPDPGPDTVSELPPSTQASFKEDRFIVKLLRQGTAVDEGEFEEIWRTVRYVSLHNRLPAALNDRQRIMAIRDAFEVDRAEGLTRLRAFLGDLETMVGRLDPPR